MRSYIAIGTPENAGRRRRAQRRAHDRRERAIVPESGHAHYSIDPLDHRVEVPLGIEPGAEDDELVSGDPGHGVGAARGLPQALGDLAQTPGRLPRDPKVVDELEVIDVAEEDSDVATLAAVRIVLAQLEMRRRLASQRYQRHLLPFT